MGAYKYIKNNFREGYSERSEAFKARITSWNSGPSIARVDKPTNVARARELGYKDKQGVITARVRIRKGLSKREKPKGGRKPSKSGRFFSTRKSRQSIAEERSSRAYSNCEVLNSYYVGEDGKSVYYEVMLLDRAAKPILSDPIYAKIVASRGRAFRGITSSGRRHRGIESRDGTRTGTGVRNIERQ